ncbi:MAG: His-Xaa-Ser system protein HxsD [Deltaproteobacteria bacterium]|nr:MAG: His-Xaa-Ser system protein HxsD [Deltaproteobacteria bacterium]
MSDVIEADIKFSEDSIHISLDESVYGLSVILKTSYSFTDKCYLLISSVGPKLVVRIAPLEDSDEKKLDFKQVAKEFCNQLLEQKMREQVLTETGTIRETIITRAFLSGNLNM